MQADPLQTERVASPPLGAALAQHFGFPAFRPGQEEIIRALLAGEDVLAVMPTGAGKSLCFQLPALLLPGITLVVSPLIALMKDQVDQLARRGIAATFINSSLPFAEQGARLEQLRHGGIRICYVAPERFRSRAFVAAVASVRVALFAVDEAHCISQWGHDFRPDYLKLRPAIDRLARPIIGAFTATATGTVMQDIVSGLGLRTPRVFAFGFDRPNLFVGCTSVASRKEKLPLVLDTIRRAQSGIVYTATRRAADELNDALQAAGVRAGAYHAGLGDDERRDVQDAFMSGRLPVVVATNAFGMGIDKPDVRFVLHHDIPRSFEAYYQEIGRAGRDGAPADCRLLFHPGDTAVQRFLIEASHPEIEVVRQVFLALRARRSRAVTLGNTELKDLAGTDVPDAAISAALKVLEDADLIERAFGARRTQVLVTGTREIADPGARALLDALRAAGADSWFEVDELSLAHASDLAPMDVPIGLRRLERAGAIEVVPATRGRVIHLLDDRGWEERLREAHAPLVERRLRELKRLAEMVSYVASRSCRRDTILAYFTGARPESGCRRCDRCTEASGPPPSGERSPERTAHEDTIVRKILSAVARMQGSYGKQKVVQVLAGAESRELTDALRGLSVFGILADLPRKTTAAAIDELVALGAIEKTRGEYPTLCLTRLGREVVHGRMPIVLQALAQPARPHRASGPADAPVAIDGVDAQLLERLRAWRAEVAAAAGQPRYTVFHDRTLMEIAALRPRTRDAFARIHGVGERKIESYWEPIAQLIATAAGSAG